MLKPAEYPQAVAFAFCRCDRSKPARNCFPRAGWWTARYFSWLIVDERQDYTERSVACATDYLLFRKYACNMNIIRKVMNRWANFLHGMTKRVYSDAKAQDLYPQISQQHLVPVLWSLMTCWAVLSGKLQTLRIMIGDSAWITPFSFDARAEMRRWHWRTITFVSLVKWITYKAWSLLAVRTAYLVCRHCSRFRSFFDNVVAGFWGQQSSGGGVWGIHRITQRYRQNGSRNLMPVEAAPNPLQHDE